MGTLRRMRATRAVPVRVVTVSAPLPRLYRPSVDVHREGGSRIPTRELIVSGAGSRADRSVSRDTRGVERLRVTALIARPAGIKSEMAVLLQTDAWPLGDDTLARFIVAFFRYLRRPETT